MKADVEARVYFRWLRYLRVLETTSAYGPYSRLSLAAVGREWGEAEWTSRDLWASR